MGRCWTADRRVRHGLQDEDSCALCSQAAETMVHLLLYCVYNREFWFLMLWHLGLQRFTPPTDVTELGGLVATLSQASAETAPQAIRHVGCARLLAFVAREEFARLLQVLAAAAPAARPVPGGSCRLDGGGLRSSVRCHLVDFLVLLLWLL
jgi:hypothetical protein